MLRLQFTLETAVISIDQHHNYVHVGSSWANICRRHKFIVSLSQSVFVSQDGNIELARGYGFANVENEEPFTADSKFAVASVSKAFTTTLAAKLFAADDRYNSFSCRYTYFEFVVGANVYRCAKQTKQWNFALRLCLMITVS